MFRLLVLSCLHLCGFTDDVMTNIGECHGEPGGTCGIDAIEQVPLKVKVNFENPFNKQIGIFFVPNRTGAEEVLITALGPMRNVFIDTFSTHRFHVRRGRSVDEKVIREYTVTEDEFQTVVCKPVSASKEQQEV
mmetsp:Transcript_45389/g.120374  ORF Transcript_45389/g.120374 Transcript_45389/m.120374 type:complete len:134 (+) Transcript_45389:42-443(+)